MYVFCNILVIRFTMVFAQALGKASLHFHLSTGIDKAKPHHTMFDANQKIAIRVMLMA